MAIKMTEAEMRMHTLQIHYTPIHSSEAFLKGKTVVIPVVSVANVAQLAVDLLIASLNLKRIGILNAKCLIPVVGAREDGEPGFTSPLELYGKDGVDVVVIQQRSPAMKELKQEFVELILKFVEASQVSAAMFLSGVDLSNRSDSQMETPIYKLVPTRTPSLKSSSLENVLALPTYTFAPAQRASEQKPSSDADIPFIPGGGLTRRFLTSLSSTGTRSDFNSKVPVACVLHFVREGDNRGDAMYFARAVANLLAIERLVSSWKEPGSWAAGLYGTTHDQTLYG